MIESVTPGAQRPTTSNPKRRNLASPEVSTSNFSPQGHSYNNVHDLDPMVLWSTDDVPAGILARPHTSNPRYVDGLMSGRGTSESPQKAMVDSGASYGVGGSPPNSETPINGPSDSSNYIATGNNSNHSPANVVSAPILWSDNMCIDPQLLARPVTANPWLQRVFDSVEKLVPSEPYVSDITDQGSTSTQGVADGVSPTAAHSSTKSKTAGILWSTDNVRDWRLLARPHSSNPILERSRQSQEATGVDQAASLGEYGSYVLWSREEPEGTSSVAEVIAAQQRQIQAMSARIAQLEQCLMGAGLPLPAQNPNHAEPSEILILDEDSGTIAARGRPVTAIPNDPSVRLTVDSNPSATTATTLAQELANAETVVYDVPREDLVSAMAASPIPPQSPYSIGDASPESNSGEISHQASKISRPKTAIGSRAGSPLAATAVPDNLDQHYDSMSPDRDDQSPRSAHKVIAPAPPKITVDNRMGRPSSRTGAESDLYIREDKGIVPNEDEVERSFQRGFQRSPTQFNRNHVNMHETVKATGFGFVPRTGEVHSGLSMPPRPESALPSRRAARLRLAIGQCRPTTAPSNRDNQYSKQSTSAQVSLSQRPSTASTTHASTEEGPRRCASATLSRPFLNTTMRHMGAVDSASYGRARDQDIRKEYANILRKGEHAVTKDDFKALYLERAAEFGMKPSDNDVEDLMAPFYKEGVNHLSLDEFAVLFLKMSAW